MNVPPDTSSDDWLALVDWDALQSEELTQVHEASGGYGRTTITCFEDLRVWQQARALANRIYDATLKGPCHSDYALRDQIRRSALSISSNIAEGFERGSRAEFLLFLNYAKGSAGELRSQVHIAADRRYLDPAEYAALVEHCKLVSGQLFTMMRNLKQKADK